MSGPVLVVKDVVAKGEAATHCAQCGRPFQYLELVTAFGADDIETEFIGPECVELRTAMYAAQGKRVRDATQEAQSGKAAKVKLDRAH